MVRIMYITGSSYNKIYKRTDFTGFMIKKCVGCGDQKEHQAKGLCYPCYRKLWKPKLIICKNCNKEKKHHAFGLCSPCHMKLHHYDIIKSYNIRKYHNLPLNIYRKLATKCLICGFDKIVDLHHLDHNKKNNSEENLIPLCPNHHKMLHKQEYKLEVELAIKDKLTKKRNY